MRSGVNFVGVLGWPLDVTWSPVIHNVAFRHLQLDWTYLRWPVAPHELGDAVRGLRSLRAAGANVTMPHKEAIIDHLDELSEVALAVGAVNTVERVGARLIGHNTDVPGFTEFLAGDAGFEAAGASALILGAGGAAKAVVQALAGLGAAEIVVAARRPEAAVPLARLIPESNHTVIDWEDAARCVSEVDLVVNATPLGMKGETLLADATFNSGQYVVDLVSSPPSTPLVDHARAQGASSWGGVGMLIRQAAASFQIWTGQQAPIEAMSAAAIRAIGHHHRPTSS